MDNKVTVTREHSNNYPIMKIRLFDSLNRIFSSLLEMFITWLCNYVFFIFIAPQETFQCMTNI